MLHFPIVDVRMLADGSESERREAVAILGAACRETGFFCVSGHGVDAYAPDHPVPAAVLRLLHYPARPAGAARAGDRGRVAASTPTTAISRCSPPMAWRASKSVNSTGLGWKSPLPRTCCCVTLGTVSVRDYLLGRLDATYDHRQAIPGAP